jgi:protein ImuB
MSKRYVAIWLCHLKTDWFTRRHPELRDVPFVLASPDHGRMVITAVNSIAQKQGINRGDAVADARVILPSLQVYDDKPELQGKLLTGLAEWCIRYTPIVAIDPPDGLILDTTGCAHLWNGESEYLKNIGTRLNDLGYTIRIAMAGTIGTAWAVSRFGENYSVIKTNEQLTALLSLPPLSLRLNTDIVERLIKLGLHHTRDFINMPRSALRRRFGEQLIRRLDQALGYEHEDILPVHPIEPYYERLDCPEPIITAKSIEIALQKLLEKLSHRLKQEQKGVRLVIFKNYRIDGKIEKLQISTNHPSRNTKHLFKLFEINIDKIEPALGIELFTIEAPKVEDISPRQEKLWGNTSRLDNVHISELLDRLAGKLGEDIIHRYLPDEHYWPERSVKLSSSLNEESTTEWRIETPRPLQLLSRPEPVEVTAPIPDYPPMLFRYKQKLHKITKADGPERIEQEWWLQQGQHRDYYYVEDEEGHRYWLFRLGHYTDKTYQWFIHGFFP